MAYGVILGQRPSIPDSGVPVGSIVIWSGTESNIPENWHLCDGTNGTPDLRGQFVIGAGTDYEVGDTGGEVEHTLTLNEMPRHTHEIPVKNSTSSTRPTIVLTDTSYYALHTSLLRDAGRSQPHNNMPPYYALCYIMKIA